LKRPSNSSQRDQRYSDPNMQHPFTDPVLGQSKSFYPTPSHTLS
jgi:hypothetical protein